MRLQREFEDQSVTGARSMSPSGFECLRSCHARARAFSTLRHSLRAGSAARAALEHPE